MFPRAMSTGFPKHLAPLLSPRAYPHPVERVEWIETHVSWVLLTGEYAYKLKRPVHYAFIDLRTLERRQFYCEEELRLNQRFAPELYVDVCEITQGSDSARVGGMGEVIEYAVRMRQFRREDELERLLAAGKIQPQELQQFGQELARIHAGLPVAGATGPFGQPDAVQTLLFENLKQAAQAVTVANASGRIQALQSSLAARLQTLEGCMAERFAAGHVRECHGDLHVLNLVRRSSHLLAFDCLEFDPAFRWIDVADEVAFLTMDLETRGFRPYANALLNGYLAQNGDYAACRMLPVYKCHRALVRAKVTALTIAHASTKDKHSRHIQFNAYLSAAEQALNPQRPMMVLMFGLSGSGKTWLARELAPCLNAVHLRSDVERKRLAGLATEARSHSPLEGGLYSREQSASVYARLARCAEEVLAGDYTVIVDATLGRRADRQLFSDLARRLGVELRVIRGHAPPEVLRARIAERDRAGRDASEANLAVLDWQETHTEAISLEEALEVIEIDTSTAEPAAQAALALQTPRRSARQWRPHESC